MDVEMGTPKPMASGSNAMISGTTGSPGVHAGLDILRRGGSAVDAAMTTALANIALNAGAPVSYAGIMSMVYYDATSNTVHSMGAGYNTVLAEDEPLTIPTMSFGPDEPAVPKPKGRTVLVPGFTAGVEAAHRRFGRLPFREIFKPAIAIAEKGIPWSSLLEYWFRFRKDILSRLPETKSVFTKENGDAYAIGDTFKQPALAETLKKVAKEGARYMYTGEWAEKFVKTVRNEGGKMAMKDLAGYEVEWREPLVISYHGYSIHLFHEAYRIACALNTFETAELSNMGHYVESSGSFYWFTRIMQIAMSAPPTKDWLDKEHIRDFWETLKADCSAEGVAAKPDDTPKHSDAIVAVDEQGNVAALLHTINTVLWGENGIFVDGISVPDSASFQQPQVESSGPGSRLRALFSHSPLIVTMDGRSVLGLSSVGRGLHWEAVKVLFNALDFGMNPKEANDAPSFIYHPDRKSAIAVKGAFSPGLIERSRKMGIEIYEIPYEEAYDFFGGVVNIAIDLESGNMEGATPTLYDGAVLGY